MTSANTAAPTAIKRRTLGEFAKAQAERHPSTPRPSRPSRTPASSFPMLIAGRPGLRSRNASEEKQEQGPEVPVLSPAALGDGVLDRHTLETTRFPARSDRSAQYLEDSLTKSGDVVVSLYPPFGCACIDAESAGVFVPNTFAIIRMDDETKQELDPWYLVGFLSTTIIRDEVLPTKTTRRGLSLEDLSLLEILLPPLATQRELGKLVQLRAATVKSLRDRLRCGQPAMCLETQSLPLDPRR